MDRREFFKRGISKATEAAVKEVDARVAARASHWIRPPFAQAELEFLLACTRCNACIEACEYAVIFSLSARLGAEVAGTPALDLLNKGCHLCQDWPCVSVCEPLALKLPEEQAETSTYSPNLAQASIDTTACLPYLGPECGACAPACPVPDALQWSQEKPNINQEHCTGCALCREACIVEPKAIVIKSVNTING